MTGVAPVKFVGWDDGSLLEAASWRLASELVRRHPTTSRLIRAHPGGGQYDCLWLLPAETGSRGSVSLNRNGTIQVLERFDGRPSDWVPTQWDEYFKADPREFLIRLEAGAGMPAPSQLPAATPMTLTLRVLATIAATGVKAVHPIEVVPGMIDTSGYGGGPNEEAFESFSAIPRELRQPRGTHLDGDYRFWFAYRDDVPVLAFEQSKALAWTQHHNAAVKLMELYAESRRHVLVTALKLLRRVDNV